MVGSLRSPGMAGTEESAGAFIQHQHHQVMKRVITSILIGVVLYFLLPFITKFIPQYRLAVWSITSAIVAFIVSAGMDRV
ncbi:hypothetical protein PMI16_00067 [Herbaspirillum sp. CF444]|nr:hypothetical protein PMI16_00067 [Herbaspirillum sp. CF444]